MRKLDGQRLGLEEYIEDALKNLQRWEAERLQAVKTVLLQLHGRSRTSPVLSKHPLSVLHPTLPYIYQTLPDSDLSALI